MPYGFLAHIPYGGAAKSLDGLSAGNLVALKGCCPSCGEEVYAFVKANESQRPRHKCECHVCSHPLIFHANLEVRQRGGTTLE